MAEMAVLVKWDSNHYSHFKQNRFWAIKFGLFLPSCCNSQVFVYCVYITISFRKHLNVKTR